MVRDVRHCQVGCNQLAQRLQQLDALSCLDRSHGALMHYAAS